jgi:hypothetical protein
MSFRSQYRGHHRGRTACVIVDRRSRPPVRYWELKGLTRRFLAGGMVTECAGKDLTPMRTWSVSVAESILRL